MVMSQNMRAVCRPASSSNGNGWNVDGSGRSRVSDSETRLNPSMEEPSKPTPSSKALSSSAGDIITVFSEPKMSVNQRRIKAISCCSTIRSTLSVWALMLLNCSGPLDVDRQAKLGGD